MSRVPRVLSIAGTDPTGGAGLQADLKAIAAHDGYGMGVVTALVAQNTRGVRSVHVPDPSFLREQLDAVSDDVTVDAVKVGMLGTADVVRVVVDWLTAHRPPWVVVDPVMVATSGDRLLAPEAEEAMTDLLVLADLVTPNRDELRVLAGLAGAAEDTDPTTAARVVARRWDVRVLAKGGHDDGATSDDALVAPDGTVRVFSAPRVATTNTHGTGCSLSSAIATLVARDGDWELAVGSAKEWLSAALRGADALEVGHGHGPVDHGAAVRAALPPVRTTDRWWTDVAAVLDEVLDCAFLRTMADGTLHPDVFTGYLAQDVHYLRAYGRHLTTLAERSSGGDAAFWSAAAEGCAAEARDLHHRRLAGTHVDTPVHPVCAAYLAHLDAAAADPETGVLAAAVLPCFQVYAWVGGQLNGVAARTRDLPAGPSDAGSPDAGAPDADPSDAGAPATDPSDAAAPAADPSDAAAPATGSSEAGPPDPWPADPGSRDAGPSDRAAPVDGAPGADDPGADDPGGAGAAGAGRVPAASGDAVPVGHPFADWLTAYADPAFAVSSARATDVVEGLTAQADPVTRGRMSRAFRASVAHELAFFRMPTG